MEVSRLLNWAANKNHFEEYNDAIRFLITAIQLQQKQIEELMLEKHLKECQQAQENELKRVLHGGK